MNQIYTDKLHRIAYATDASVYRELPLGVSYPETIEDIQALVAEAARHETHLIPRAGGTSIAGQVVGSGIVCDISKHWNKILEINPSQRWARVQPGVVRDELNLVLKPHGLFFSPETSTSNRCCIGGMLGNNSCGTHSLVYGSTRHHVLEAVGVLSDGSVEHFRDYTVSELEERFGPRFWEKESDKEENAMRLRHADRNVDDACEESVVCSSEEISDSRKLVERIYAQIIRWGLNEETVRLVRDSFPDASLRRRSCGYAIDETIASLLKDRRGNLCPLLCGSEGTLAFITEIKVSLDPLPPAERMVVCAHCNSLEDSLYANLAALKHGPVAVELMDGQILELSEGNLEQQRNRFFIEGKPAALIIAEFEGPDMEAKASAFEAEVLGQSVTDNTAYSPKNNKEYTGSIIGESEKSERMQLAYCCTRVYGKDISRVWELRKAGLGVLSGMKGDAKPVGVIEDTAVAPERMPAYIADFKQMLERVGLRCVYYGHISTGELHLRPILNLKDPLDRMKFREVAHETARLVLKHRGSLSGEHGDGRLRGEFIPMMYGHRVYQMMRQVKAVWDPSGVFNIGKITDTPPMDEYLRYLLNDEASYILPEKTFFRWNGGFTHGESNPYAMLCGIEQCNGAGACRKSNAMGGTMCPAFKVSGDEFCVTRARANVIRELLTYGFDGLDGVDSGKRMCKNKSFRELVKSTEIEEVLFSCLACKGCRSECPSNVDMTRLRAELLQHKWDAQGTPLGVWMVARMAAFERLGHLVRPLYNFFAGWKVSERMIKSVVRFASERHIPKLSRMSMRTLVKRELRKSSALTGLNTGCAPTGNVKVEPDSVERGRKGKVYLFADEFTNYQEAELGLTFAKLLISLGYNVEIPHHVESGRAAISKGCLRLAKKFAKRNVELLGDIVSAETPLVGIEPSCILSFRDEYPDLVPEEMAEKAKSLGRNALLYDEFLVREMGKGNITAEMFREKAAEIYLHGHCHQKALVGIEKTEKALRGLLSGAIVHTIPSSCCGMAGSFGYEKAHYKTSMAIGEMVLFPAVRKAVSSDEKPVLVAAPGTSCRQQILDGTGVKAKHPIEILYDYLKDNNH